MWVLLLKNLRHSDGTFRRLTVTNMEEIVKALDNTRDLSYALEKPRAIIANTYQGLSYFFHDERTR